MSSREIEEAMEKASKPTRKCSSLSCSRPLGNACSVYLFSSLVFVLLCGKPVSACGTHGFMTGDNVIQRGSNIALDCNLYGRKVNINGNDYDVDSSMIKFTFKNQILGGERISILNGTAAQVNIKQADLSDAGYYFCFLDIPNSRLNMTLVCNSELKVGLAPSKELVAKFSCISLHYYTLTCSWEPPDYHIKTAFTVQEKAYSGHLFNCANRINDTACSWDLSSDPRYRLHEKELKFRLTATNHLGTHFNDYTIDHFSIIKPDKPKEFALIDVSSTSVRLSWSVPDYFEEDVEPDDWSPMLEYEILLQPKNGDQERRIPLGSGRTYNASGLLPLTTYVFSLRCKTTAASDEQMWSAYSNVSTSTKPDVPYTSPRFIPNSYEVVKSSDTTRSITLYWEPVELKYRGAEGLHYVIEYEPTFLERNKRESGYRGGRPNTVKVTSDKSSYTFPQMSTEAAYAFKIVAANDLGVSKAFSKIKVAELKRLPEKPIEVTAFYYGEGKGYEVQWKKPLSVPQGKVSSYTVTWCKAIPHAVEKCSKQLSSLTVEPTSNQNLAAFISNLEEDATYQFAVSANVELTSDVLSSGLSWASCIVPIGLKHIQKITEFHMLASNSTSLHVKWKLPCLALASVIDKFQVMCCRLEDDKSCQTVDIKEGDAEQTIITGLEPNTRYKLTLRAWTGNMTGEQSDPIIVTTLNPEVTYVTPGTKIWVVMIIVFASTITFGLIIFITWMSVRKFKKMYDDIKKTGIELPRGLAVQQLDINGDGHGHHSDRMLHNQFSESSTNLSHDEFDVKFRHGSGTSHSSAASTGFASSGHGSGTSPSNSSTGIVVVSSGSHLLAESDTTRVQVEEDVSHFKRTLSEPTSETGESIDSHELQPISSRGCHEEVTNFSVAPSQPMEAAFARQTNGYVTLPCNSPWR